MRHLTIRVHPAQLVFWFVCALAGVLVVVLTGGAR
jgi:hypothetical protein